MENEKWKMIYGKWFSFSHRSFPLRRNVSLPRADLSLFLNSADFYSNRAKLAITVLIRRIVAQTVLRSDLVCHLSKGCARVLQSSRHKVLTTTRLCQIIHLAAREVIKLPA